MNPENANRSSSGPAEARGLVGNYGAAGPGESGPGDAGQGGASANSGETTSQFADRGAMNDLLASQADEPQSPPVHTQAATGHGQPHGASPDRKPSSPQSPQKSGGKPGGQPGGHPAGDRTTAVETTDDPSLMGDWKPNGVVGGKGTFSGAGGSSAAAPDHIPVQPGGADGAAEQGTPGGAGGPSDAPRPAGMPTRPNSTESMIASHLPRPLPEPAANSIAAERYVVVTINSESIQVGSHEIPLEDGMSNRVLETQFSKELAAAAKRWGRPPAGFHWQPSLRFRVLPGGNQYYAWLQSASEEWELRNTVEYVFE